MPLLRGGVLDLVLFEVLAPESKGNQFLGAADLHATGKLQEFPEGLFSGMPVMGFNEELACSNGLLVPSLRSRRRPL